jgi:hypothetical protein
MNRTGTYCELRLLAIGRLDPVLARPETLAAKKWLNIPRKCDARSFLSAFSKRTVSDKHSARPFFLRLVHGCRAPHDDGTAIGRTSHCLQPAELIQLLL